VVNSGSEPRTVGERSHSLSEIGPRNPPQVGGSGQVGCEQLTFAANQLAKLLSASSGVGMQPSPIIALASCTAGRASMRWSLIASPAANPE
jgi:hypothetical protein